MGSDDLFKKRRAERQQRKHEFKIPKANSFLIVTEGERTEPLYFNGLKKLIEEKIGGMVDIVEVPTIDVFGEGSSTEKLIEITEKRVKDAKIFFKIFGWFLIKMILRILMKRFVMEKNEDIR